MRYLLRRVAQSLFLLAGVSLLSFAFVQLAPGSFFSEVRLNPQVSEATVERMRSQFSFDQPFHVRYWRWFRSAMRGDLGFSLAYNTPVGPLLAERAGNTLILTSLAMCLSWCAALVLGIFSAAAPQGIIARLSAIGSATLLATPELLLALLGLLVAVRTGWIRRLGMGSSVEVAHGWGSFSRFASHIALPIFVLSLTNIPLLFQHTESAVREALHSPYIAAARANGIEPIRILWRHALPASLNPLTTLLGTSLASLLSASLLVEVIVGWPGVGPLLLEAILNRDIYVVIAGVMLSALFLIGGMFTADMLLFAVDPRIRTERLV